VLNGFKVFRGAVIDVDDATLKRVRRGMLNGDVDRNLPVRSEFMYLCREVRQPLTDGDLIPESAKDELSWLSELQIQRLLVYGRNAVVCWGSFFLVECEIYFVREMVLIVIRYVAWDGYSGNSSVPCCNSPLLDLIT
jgi:hypothetical protein